SSPRKLEPRLRVVRVMRPLEFLRRQIPQGGVPPDAVVHRGVLQPRPAALLLGVFVSGGIGADALPEPPLTSAPFFLGKTSSHTLFVQERLWPCSRVGVALIIESEGLFRRGHSASPRPHLQARDASMSDTQVAPNDTATQRLLEALDGS